ncbi:glucuronide transporter [Micrococcales bacterium 31B]|nr:glucuronide transporter [Micrococcales bacterium 31B]
MNQKLTSLQVVGYGAGDLANNLAFTLSTTYLLLYYTDVAGISAAAAGTLFLLVRFFDAFADVFAGRIVDRTFHKKLGKFRPFVLFGGLPLLIMSALTFQVPSGLSHDGKLWYAYLTYAGLGLAYSMVNIPYGSLAGAMTQDPAERSKLGAARSCGGLLVGSFLLYFVTPLTKQGADKLQPLFTTLTLVFIVLGYALYLMTVFTSKERVHRTVPKVSFKQSLETLKGNRPLLMLCVSSLLMLTASTGVSTIQVYYLRDVLGNVDLSRPLAITNLVLAIIVIALTPLLVRTFGKKAVYLVACTLVVVGSVGVAFIPHHATYGAFTALVVTQLGIQVMNIVVWALEADTVEYGELRTGIRTEGIIYSLFSFTRKMGQALGGAVIAYAIGAANYVKPPADAAAAETFRQSEATISGLQLAAGLVPLVLALLGLAIMRFYTLTDKAHAEMVNEIRARREASENNPTHNAH